MSGILFVHQAMVSRLGDGDVLIEPLAHNTVDIALPLGVIVGVGNAGAEIGAVGCNIVVQVGDKFTAEFGLFVGINIVSKHVFRLQALCSAVLEVLQQL